MDDADLGHRLLKLLGEAACRELLAVPEWSEPERTALIGGLVRERAGQALAEVLADVESDLADRVRSG